MPRLKDNVLRVTPMSPLKSPGNFNWNYFSALARCLICNLYYEGQCYIRRVTFFFFFWNPDSETVCWPPAPLHLRNKHKIFFFPRKDSEYLWLSIFKSQLKQHSKLQWEKVPKAKAIHGNGNKQQNKQKNLHVFILHFKAAVLLAARHCLKIHETP